MTPLSEQQIERLQFRAVKEIDSALMHNPKYAAVRQRINGLGTGKPDDQLRSIRYCLKCAQGTADIRELRDELKERTQNLIAEHYKARAVKLYTWRYAPGDAQFARVHVPHEGQWHWGLVVAFAQALKVYPEATVIHCRKDPMPENADAS